MTGRTRRNKALGLALVACGMCSVVLTGDLAAYTVITRDGHRIEVRTKPEVRGLQAFMRLHPHGQLAVMQEELIDWDRTAGANVAPAPLAVPSGATLVEGRPGTAPAPRNPVEVRIVGGRSEPGPPAAAAGPAPATVASQEALINLQKEYAKLSHLRDEAAEQKAFLEDQLVRAQSEQAAFAGDDNSAARQIREIQDRLSEARAAIEKYEIRMNDIRSEAVQLGGSIE